MNIYICKLRGGEKHDFTYIYNVLSDFSAVTPAREGRVNLSNKYITLEDYKVDNLVFTGDAQ